MLTIAERKLAASAMKTLSQIQDLVDSEADYPARVISAKNEWSSKTSTIVKREAFSTIRSTLATMCVGSVRCSYCEDSLADEVEHIAPKNLFPEHAFKWANYLFACGPCNGPKSNRYGVLVGDFVQEFVRKKNDPIVPPPAGPSGFINPRIEDPLSFLELDLGGTAPGGKVIDGTFELLPRDGLSNGESARADFTIKVLGLNREVIRIARANAFGGFRARMVEYVQKLEAGAGESVLLGLQKDLLATPHLTVFVEIRRQRTLLPELNDLLDRAPEMMGWDVVPAAEDDEE
jgi:hypothetical protein